MEENLQKDKSKKLSISLSFGHIIECFDNTLYGFFAVLLAPLFFPSTSHNATLLASYGAFAAGFFARPLGAIIFGSLGDRLGRRIPLLISMMLVGIPTITIGLLPTYENIGMLSPVLLLSCRLLQGFFMGGEFSGVNVYITETYDPSTLGTQTGKLIALGVTGAILATIVGSGVTLPFFPDWFWRVPFVFGGCMAFIFYFFRKKLTETAEFEEMKTNQEQICTPWADLFTSYKMPIVVCSLIAGLTIVPLYCCTILGNKIFNSLGYSPPQCMMLNTFGMIMDAVFTFYCGILADRLGFHRQMILGMVTTILISFPAFYLISGVSTTTFELIIYIFLLVGFGCIINGCAMPYIAAYFPVSCRYSGVALSVTLGHALFGGTTPFVGSFLIDTYQNNAAPIFWVIGLSILTLIGIMLARNHHYYPKEIQL